MFSKVNFCLFILSKFSFNEFGGVCEGVPFPSNLRLQTNIASLKCLNWINDLFFCLKLKSRDAQPHLMPLFHIPFSLTSKEKIFNSLCDVNTIKRRYAIEYCSIALR